MQLQIYEIFHTFVDMTQSLLIMASLTGSVEFYVIAAFVATAIVALCVRPSGRGEAITEFITSRLSADGYTDACIEVTVDDALRVHIIRHGLTDIRSGASVALALTRIVFDISIEERVAASPDGYMVDSAEFVIDNLGPERYHIKYNSSESGRFAAFTLTVKPGIHIIKPMM